jgi:hypothetical protein
MDVTAALRGARSAPPEFERFMQQQEYWKRLGIPAAASLGDLPVRERQAYDLIIIAIGREEQIQRARNS